MKKALIYVVHEDFMAFEEAVDKYNNGYDIYFITCDCSVGICGFNNPYGSKSICKLCNRSTSKYIGELCNKDPHRYHHISISKIVTPEIVRNASSMVFDYDDTSSLKNLEYKGVEIGFGAFSTFVTVTRNVMPTYNKYLKAYLDYLMRKEVIMTDALLKYVEELKPDLIVYHNGRMSNYKPICCIARNLGIDYIATERIIKNGIYYGNNFFNDIPHSFKARSDKMEAAWDNNAEKVAVAKKFFEDRYLARPAGDKIYTKDQKLGELPDGFDPQKRNITIFNSSEDEYCSISKEIDKSGLFPNQYEALKTIFEHYKNNNDIHFYLRIHPNLADVPFRSHTALYELKYDNVTIIPPKSQISSYTLMENSEKVIVFMSTMGLESSYWGKPVIALYRTVYSFLDIVYQPREVDEMFRMIDNPTLPHKDRSKENWYKAAYYLLKYHATPLIHYPCKLIRYSIPYIGVSGHVTSTQKICGSTFLYMIVYKILNYSAYYGINGEFSQNYLNNTK